MAKVTGNRELSWKTTVDVEESKRRLEQLKKGFSEVEITIRQGQKTMQEWQRSISGLGKFDMKSMMPANDSNWKAAQAGILELLAKTRQELAELKNAYQELKNKQEEGKISIQGLTEQIAQQKLKQAELRTELDAGKLSQSVYNDMIAESKVRQQELNEAVKRQTLSDKEYTRQLKEKSQAEKEGKATLKASHAEYQAAAGSYEEANKKAQGLLKTIKAAPGGFESQTAAMKSQIAEYIKLNDGLKAFDAGLGNFHRQVGDYKQGFSGLSNSINQITRELPAFTYSAQTGFLAISNNLPILFDEISKVSQILKESSIGSAQAAGEQAKATSLAGGASEEAASQVGDLAKAQALQAAEGKRGISMLKAIGSALFSWGTLLSVGVTLLTVYGKEIGEWIGALFKGKDAVDELARSQKVLQDALIKGGQDGQAEATNLRVLYGLTQDNTLSLKRRKEAVAELQKQWPGQFKNLKDEVIISGNARVAYDDLTKSIIATAKARAYQDVMAENAKRRFANDETIAKAEIEYNKSISTAKTSLNKIEGESARFYAREAANAEKDRAAAAKVITDARKDNILLGQRDLKLQERITEQIKTGAKITDYVDPEKRKGPKGDSLLSARNTLQNEIQDLIRGSLKVQLDADAEAVDSVTIKYEKIRQKTKEHYEKVNKIITDPKKRAIYNLDVSGINEAETREKTDILYKQDTKALIASLDTQKGLYAEYEDYKTALGKKAADDRFGAEISTNKKYADVLQDEYEKILNAGSKSGFTGAMRERMKTLETSIRAEGVAEDKKNDELLKQFRTYTDERAAIQEKYLATAAELRKDGHEKEAQIAIDAGVQEVNALDEANVKKWDSYKNLFDFVGERTKKQTYEVIAAYEAELKSANLTVAARAKLEKEIAALKRSLHEKDGLNDVIQGLEQIASEFNGINSSIGAITSTLLTAAKAYLQIQKGIKVVKDPESSTTDKITAGLGIAGAAIGVAKSVFGYFSGLKAAKEAAKKAMDDYNQAAIKGELEYQALLRKREVDDAGRGKSSYQALVAQLDLLKKQSPELQKAYDKIFATIQGEQYVEGIGSKHGTWLRKAKTWDIMASLAGSDYDNLEKLYTQGKLKDAAKADFESLKSLREELKAAGLDVEGLQKQLGEMLTGTSVSGLADGLKALLENGKRSAQDFGDSFEEIIKNSLLNSFKVKYLDDAMNPFYDELANLMSAGTPTDAQIAALKNKYVKVGQEADEYLKNIEKITGENLSKGSTTSGTNSNTLQGAISSMTAGQADLLSGQFGGLRITQIETNTILKSNGLTFGEMYNIAMNNFNVSVAIEANTRRTADNTESLKRLEKVETTLVSIDKKMESKANALQGTGRG
jgi:hypothetical protein